MSPVKCKSVFVLPAELQARVGLEGALYNAMLMQQNDITAETMFGPNG